MSGAGDYDGIVLKVVVVNADFDRFKWKIVLPPGAAVPTEYAFPRLPPDLIGLWADKDINDLQVTAADTSATSYAEFRRDAVTESDWEWMRAPTQPQKVRIGTHTSSTVAPDSTTVAGGRSRARRCLGVEPHSVAGCGARTVTP